MSKLHSHYYKILGAILVVGCVLNPISAAVGLLIVFAAKLTDKFLTSNISDAERTELQSMKSEVQKLKAKAEQQDLSKAFRS